MTFQALLVSSDEEAAGILSPVLSEFGVGMAACSHDEATELLQATKFDAVIVDYDEADKASSVLQSVYQNAARTCAVTVALLKDRSKVRNVFGAGANFVLYKPIYREQARASLRAATALIKRERRRSFRVPVQVPVQLHVENSTEMEGILLDLSEDGMDVLAAQPLCPSAHITCRFNVDMTGEIVVSGEIAWANPNGQSGVRFVDLTEEMRQSLKEWVAANAPELPPDDPEPVSQCKLTDMSLGGCYVETESPFPERSSIVLSLTAGDMEVQAEGVVRVMHPGYGMGIEFASRTEEQREQVGSFIDLLSNTPGTMPKLAVLPRSLVAGYDAVEDPGDSGDALLELLRSHEAMSQEEFLQALRNQRGSEEAVPS